MILDPSNFPDPEKTPYTWHLDRAIEKHLRGERINPDHENTPDIVCNPGHSLIVKTTEAIFRRGMPGLWDGNWEKFDPYEFMARGMMDPNFFASRLPLFGRFILYLWILREFIETGARTWNLRDISFRMLPLAKMKPAMTCDALILEWWWMQEFLQLSCLVGEPRLDVIPGCWPEGSVREVVRHPEWIQKKKALEEGLPNMPYVLTSLDGWNPWRIQASFQSEDALRQLIIIMATYEIFIHQTLWIVIYIWSRMRSSDQLQPEDIDKVLLTRMNWQRGLWSEPYRRDSKLQTTDMRMAFIQNWADPVSRTDMGKRSADIGHIFKRASGYGPGNRGRAEANVDEPAQNLIKEVLPDLEKILKVALPKWSEDGRVELPKIMGLARGGKLKCLGEKHLRFLKTDWKHVKGNDRLDLCTKIVAEYLEDKTGVRYRLESLRQFIELTS